MGIYHTESSLFWFLHNIAYPEREQYDGGYISIQVGICSSINFFNDEHRSYSGKKCFHFHALLHEIVLYLTLAFPIHQGTMYQVSPSFIDTTIHWTGRSATSSGCFKISSTRFMVFLEFLCPTSSPFFLFKILQYSREYTRGGF